MNRKSGSFAQSGKQQWCGLPGGVVVSSPSRDNPRFLEAPGEGADVRRGVFTCRNLKQSSRGVVLVQYTYGDGILTRIVGGGAQKASVGTYPCIRPLRQCHTKVCQEAA